MSGEKAAKDISAKGGLGNLLFDPKEKAKVEYAFLNNLLNHLAKLGQPFSSANNEE